jgi:hypothetical protein
MSTSHPRFTAHIEGTPEAIFDLIADMPNYHHWLPGSDAFGGTTEVVPYPVRLGTTYLDAGPAGKRPGSVTRFDPPKHITFHHTMLLKRGPLTADIDVDVRYTLEPMERGTFVIRDLDLTIEIPGFLRVAEPLVLWAFRKENVRILAELKRYVEAQKNKPIASPLCRK